MVATKLIEEMTTFLQDLDEGDVVKRLVLEALINLLKWVVNFPMVAFVAFGIVLLLCGLFYYLVVKGGLAQGLLGCLVIASAIILSLGGTDIYGAVTNSKDTATTITVEESSNDSETSSEEEDDDSSEISPEEEEGTDSDVEEEDSSTEDEEEEQETHWNDFLSDEDKAVYSEQWNTLYERWSIFLSYADDTSIINIDRMVASANYVFWLARMQNNYPLIYIIWQKYGIQLEDFEDAYQAYLQNDTGGYSNITEPFSFGSGGGFSFSS